jgi:hypothetical protein
MVIYNDDGFTACERFYPMGKRQELNKTNTYSIETSFSKIAEIARDGKISCNFPEQNILLDLEYLLDLGYLFLDEYKYIYCQLSPGP